MQKETIAHTAEQNTDTTEDMISSLVAISIVAKRLAKQMPKNEPKGQKEETHMNKCYGLVGKTIKVKFKKGDSDAYPWQGQAVPVLITGEYDNFLVGTVLPHHAPHGFGLSIPYPVTINKHDIQIGEMILNGGAIV